MDLFICPICCRLQKKIDSFVQKCKYCGNDIPMNNMTTPLQDDYQEMIDNIGIKKIKIWEFNF